MTYELYILFGATLLGLVHVSTASFSFKAQVGNRYTVGARDEGIEPVGIAARLARANSNFLETYAFFAVCVFLVNLTETSGQLSRIGSLLYLGGRIAFLPLYAIGVPWIRTFSWNVATFGLALVGLQSIMPVIGE